MSKLKIQKVTFGNAVRLGKNVEAYVTSYGTKYELEYDTDHQLLYVTHPGHPVVVVGVTNIKEMTLEPETSGIDSGVETTKPTETKVSRRKVS